MHLRGGMTDERAGRDGALEQRLQRLLETVRALGGVDEHRRDELVEAAEERGLERPDAEQAYDIAQEEGLEPAYGIALVLEGVSVRPLPAPRPDVQTSEPNEPEWVDTPPDAAQAERERRLRQTFRRFRSTLGDEGAPDAALARFRDEPDLEPYDY